MRKFISSFFVVFVLLMGEAFAQATPTPLTQQEIDAINAANIPEGGIQLNLSEASKNEVSSETCKKTLKGLGVSDKCCEDATCVRKALKKHADNTAHEKRRAEVNKKFCTEYGGSSSICSNAETARQYVLRHRENLKRIEEQEKTARAITASVKPATVADFSSGDPSATVVPATPVDTDVSHHHLEMGLGLVGHIDGAYGAQFYTTYRPPILGERLGIGLGLGGVVVIHNRLALTNFSPIFRLYGDLNLSYRVLNSEKFSLAVGGSFNRIGQFGLDKLTASMIGPTMTMNIGVLRLHAAYLFNMGPEDGYLPRKGGLFLGLGFRFVEW
jgi:hypothetical protein